MDKKITQSLLFLNCVYTLSILIYLETSSAEISFCSNNTMFGNNTQYQTNLNTLFRFLNSNATNPYGYHQAEAGHGNTRSEVVYGHFLCRGDQNTTSCQNCVTTATNTDLPIICPNRKEAIIWYDYCMVRYSNQSFFGKLDTSMRMTPTNPNSIMGNLTQFEQLVENMMIKVAVSAANGGSLKKYAGDLANYTTSSSQFLETIYGLGQCTPDLSVSNCYTCLVDGIQRFPKDTQGAQALQPSCIVRYEIYPFFNNASSLPQPPTQVPSAESFNSREKGKVSGKMIIIIVISVVGVAISAILLVLGVHFQKKRAKKFNSDLGNGEDFNTLQSLQYDLHTLQSATNYFSDEKKLGKGGFGSVFEGVLQNGDHIAVKRLSEDSDQGLQEFKNEVLVLAKLRHRNLVKLLGYCLEKEEKLLVYEYVANKSLDYFLFDLKRQRQLDWKKRYKIIEGIARGMLYLHVDADPKIIHRDLKAGNILLTKDMNAKVADFGMARIFSADQTHANTRIIAGTYGYMSPEYAMHGEFSSKSDVYSFGVLVLEIISGRKNSKFCQTDHAGDLLGYAWKLWRDNKAMDFLDPTIKQSCQSQEVMRCMNLSLLCVQEAVDNRPSMSTVVHILHTKSVSLRAPQQPGFFINSEIGETTSKGIFSKETLSKSVNDLTVTDIDPR